MLSPLIATAINSMLRGNFQAAGGADGSSARAPAAVIDCRSNKFAQNAIPNFRHVRV
jgi:hypothetical protein